MVFNKLWKTGSNTIGHCIFICEHLLLTLLQYYQQIFRFMLLTMVCEITGFCVDKSGFLEIFW